MRRIATLLLFSILLFGCDSGPGPNTEPGVDFTLTPENPRAGTAITFEADANDPDGTIESYEWSTSDGAQGEGSSFTHAFAEQGSHTVTLTVTDDRDGTASETKSLDIRQRYTEVTIESVTVRDMPFTNDSGQGWDSSSGPDVYMTAYNVSSDTREATSGYYSNVGRVDLPLHYTDTPFTISDLSNEYSINLWDSDYSNDELIGGVSYTYSELVGEYPETFTLEAGEITYDVELDWGN
jgi:hypothetical protein